MTALALVPAVRDVGELYERHIVADGKEPQFIILVSFLLTFVAVRGVTHAIRAGRFRRVLRDVVSPGGTHLHHLVVGIVLLLVVGYAAIGLDPAGDRGAYAVLFGIGAALTLDEFALWLRLRDVYWEREGRASIDAVIVTAALLALGILGQGFWVEVFEEMIRLER